MLSNQAAADELDVELSKATGIAAMLRDTNVKTRRGAAAALVELNHAVLPAAFEEILRGFRDDDEKVRESIVRASRNLPECSIDLQVALAVAMSDSSESVKEAAIDSAVSFASVSATLSPIIRRSLGHGTSPEPAGPRREEVRLVEQLLHQPNDEHLEFYLDRFSQTLGDRDTASRTESGRLLAPALAFVVMGDRWHELGRSAKISVLSVFGSTGDPLRPLLPDLITRLAGEDIGVRIQGLIAAIRIDTREYVNFLDDVRTLLEVSHAPFQQIGLNLADAVFTHTLADDQIPMFDLLTDLVDRLEPEVRARAITVIGSASPVHALPWLIARRVEGDSVEITKALTDAMASCWARASASVRQHLAPTLSSDLDEKSA